MAIQNHLHLDKFFKSALLEKMTETLD